MSVYLFILMGCRFFIFFID